ncbi:unnamed protein product [Blepharisma stoltei]|uniref:C2H2-type domain-containing protein n=1 Tax=Blepharisma stoltei TaxID=1481888 RepID=A0AAU9K5H8_9CILI|nr:unnamed protein product [Blepharisma stoltei]
MQGSYSCPFDYQEFESRSELEAHIERRHVCYQADDPEADNGRNDRTSSSSSFLSFGDEGAPLPSAQSKRNLSSILTDVKIPENPLSDIGSLTEKRILQISKSPNLGALKELKLNGKGLSQFETNDHINLSRLFNLKILDLSDNYITSLRGVGQCTNLRYLNVNNNSIEDLSPLQALIRLSTFKAAHNKIKDISPLRICKRIVCLKVSNNQIFSFENTLEVLKGFPKLTHLSIFMNPCMVKTKDSKDKLLYHLWLEKLDSVHVNNEDRQQATQKVPISLRRGSHIKLMEENSDLPRMAISELHHRDTKEKNAELETQINALKEENAKLREELGNVWQLLGTIIKSRDESGQGKLLLSEFKKLKLLENIKEEEEDY